MMEKAIELYALENYDFRPVPGHEGGRNLVYICSLNGENRYVLRISALDDRTEEDYLAETEFVRYLARNGAPVADVIPSVRGKAVEFMEQDEKNVFFTLFEYAKGILLSDNGYRYREGASLDEYSIIPERHWGPFTGCPNSTDRFIAERRFPRNILRSISAA